MNKIGRWHKLKKVLPVPNRPVLLDLGDARYTVSRLHFYDGTEPEDHLIFLSDANNDPKVTKGEDVKRWAYIKLEKYY